MSRKAPARSWFAPAHPEDKVVVVLPVGDLPLSCYQSRRKCFELAHFIVALEPSLRPGRGVHPCWPLAPLEFLQWRPQQDRRKLLHTQRSTSLSSQSSSSASTSARGKRRPTHMANSTSVPKRTSSNNRAAAQPTYFTYVVTPQQVAYSYPLHGVKKLTLTKEIKDRIPAAMRQHYLDLFTEECLKFSSSHLEATKMAQSEEKAVYDRSSSKDKYLNVALQALKKLRGMVPSGVPGLDKATLYSRLRIYTLSEEERKELGFPFAHPEKPGLAILFTQEQPRSPTHATCCRCGTEFPVSSSGLCLSSDPCVFHWGRRTSVRVLGGFETWYTCCQASVGTMGCTVVKQHVQDGRKNNLNGFAKTFPKKDWEAHAGIYALDCEMCYTTHGMEVTRVSVVDTDLHVIYDTFVKPDNEIVDYATVFSGVTAADLANTNVRLRDVQAVLLSLFSTDTILIGHSLESDLLALKLIHGTVVDTSILFPHFRGLPYKRALRKIVSQYLNQTIQNDNNGHSSIEDARACMRLVTWRVQQYDKFFSPPLQQQATCPKCALHQKLRVCISRHTQTPEVPEMLEKQ
ncbi:hypothetical protein STEG23_017248 [Scotinomys teguina]